MENNISKIAFLYEEAFYAIAEVNEQCENILEAVTEHFDQDEFFLTGEFNFDSFYCGYFAGIGICLYYEYTRGPKFSIESLLPYIKDGKLITTSMLKSAKIDNI